MPVVGFGAVAGRVCWARLAIAIICQQSAKSCPSSMCEERLLYVDLWSTPCLGNAMYVGIKYQIVVVNSSVSDLFGFPCGDPGYKPHRNMVSR